MVKVLLKVLAIGVGGLALLFPVIYLIIYFNISRDTLIGILGIGSLAVSLFIIVFGIALFFKASISKFSLLRSFLSTGYFVAGIGFWNLINAGWLNVTFI
ncbi:hypothetical protein MARLIPOL_07219 [Marinobacter lipolyticus SM19]|uniref:Uncharacterized protein n=1 Tax=Marinobacter lipolyticus SM19 TaxID=1318628 RepID=R8B1R1_9GAMM|nr:hypothetical protein MARLIPOL_07219 [Marinobacter lipolyticus SM19]